MYPCQIVIGVSVSDLNSNFETLIRRVIREELSLLSEELRREERSTTTRFLSATEAANIAGVQPSTVRDWVARGDLQSYRAGRLLRVDREDLINYLGRADVIARPMNCNKRAEAILATLEENK